MPSHFQGLLLLFDSGQCIGVFWSTCSVRLRFMTLAVFSVCFSRISSHTQNREFTCKSVEFLFLPEMYYSVTHFIKPLDFNLHSMVKQVTICSSGNIQDTSYNNDVTCLLLNGVNISDTACIAIIHIYIFNKRFIINPNCLDFICTHYVIIASFPCKSNIQWTLPICNLNVTKICIHGGIVFD